MNYKPSDAFYMMQKELEANGVPILIGGTGIGKSALIGDLIELLAEGREIISSPSPKKNQFGRVDFRCSTIEASDLSIPYVVEGVQKRAFLDTLPTCGEGILFLDEFGQAQQSVQVVMSQLLYEKAIAEYELPTPENGKGNWKVVVASNRSTDRAGSSKLPSHSFSRTGVIEVISDFNDWYSWAIKNEVHTDILGFLSYQPNLLNVFDPKIIAPQPCPRQWVSFSNILKTSPEKKYIPMLADCHLGETASMEFSSFLNLKEDVPDLLKICSGEETQLPSEKSGKKLNGILFATVVALVTVIKESKESLSKGYFEHAMAYIESFPTPEFAIFFVRTLTEARPELRETVAFNEFEVKHHELTF